MTNPQIQLNSVPNEPSLSDLLNLLKKEIFLDLNCHHLGTIQSFNSENQTVTATINYQKTIFQLNENTSLYQPVVINYPLLVDMPVVILGGGKTNITFPISQGDQCLILFNDRSIDNWFQSGQVGPVSSSRYHSFADGIALVGLNNLNSFIENYDTARAALFYGQTKIAVGQSLILLNNSAGNSLGTILNNLMQQLSSLMSALTTAFATPSSPGNPLDPGWSAATESIMEALTEIQSDLQGLLE